jgi:hypothetical protein
MSKHEYSLTLEEFAQRVHSEFLLTPDEADELREQIVRLLEENKRLRKNALHPCPGAVEFASAAITGLLANDSYSFNNIELAQVAINIAVAAHNEMKSAIQAGRFQ